MEPEADKMFDDIWNHIRDSYVENRQDASWSKGKDCKMFQGMAIEDMSILEWMIQYRFGYILNRVKSGDT